MMRETFYRTSFSRHIYSVLINGFMARELDADDHEFLEQVRVRGIANGELPNTSLASMEELEFWQLPYVEAPEVERRQGPMPTRGTRPVETLEQRQLRFARTNAWHARREIRKAERAIADAEMARERAEYEAAKERRLRQDLMSDAEWNAADPFKRKRAPKLQFGKTIDRHYIPQWKLDEGYDALLAKAEARKERRAEAKAAKEQARIDAELKRDAEILAEQEYQRRRQEARIEESNRLLDHYRRLAIETRTAPPQPWTPTTLRPAILHLLRSNATQAWSDENVARVLGCEWDMMIDCLKQLARESLIKRIE